MTSPTLWTQLRNEKDCYFCKRNIVSCKNLKAQKTKYANVSSVTKPTVPCNKHVENIETSKNIEDVEKNVVSALNKIAIETYSHEEYAIDSGASNPDDDNSEDDFLTSRQQKKPKCYTQESLNHLIRDLGLPNNAAEHLASDLKRRNLVTKGVQSTVHYRTREKSLLKFFSRDTDLVYCSGVNGLMIN